MMALTLAGRAQSPAYSVDPLAAALQQGALTIWLVTPATPADKERLAMQEALRTAGPPATIEEHTASSFGTAASDTGQTASSYGKSASDFGQTASSTGQTAGSVGQTAGSFGKNASDTGQTAGSYGKPASEFGQTASSAGQTAGSYNGSQSSSVKPGDDARARHASSMHNWLSDRLQAQHPHMEMNVIPVVDEELQQRLNDVAGSADYPDLLIERRGDTLPDLNTKVLQSLGGPPLLETKARRNGTRTGILDILKMGSIGSSAISVEILADAPHQDAARAFAVWSRDVELCKYICTVQTPSALAAAPAGVASTALARMLQGNTLGGVADADAAEFLGPLTQSMALTASSAQPALGALQLHIDTLKTDMNARLAVVMLRAIVSSNDSFGVVHALAILRKNADGRWKVLQLSPNMEDAALLRAQDVWGDYYAGKFAQKETLRGISQASPVDGDNRTVAPDLWWDNQGGASLQVVEWQMRVGPGWTGSSLVLVPDTDPQLKTQVRAEFASQMGAEYRWRVWSAGKGGMMVLSPWRTLHITGR